MNEKNESVQTKTKYSGTPMTISGNDLVPVTESAEMKLYAEVLAVENEELETLTETTYVDMTEVCEKLDVTNATLALLTFFTIFAWVEQKIRSGVRRIMKHE